MRPEIKWRVADVTETNTLRRGGSNLSAGGNATVWAAVNETGNVSAGADADDKAWGNLDGNTSAGVDASVTASSVPCHRARGSSASAKMQS